MLSFLFWNIYKKPLAENIARMALHYDVDVIMLVESNINPADLLILLNQSLATNLIGYEYAPQYDCTKVQIFTKFSSQFIPPYDDYDRLTVRHLKLPAREDFLLAITHFPSKNDFTESDQLSESIELSNYIKDAENRIGHQKTILVGDLNMNPFEEGLVNANALHSVMKRNIAEKKNRIVQNKSYPFFYNPMWRFFGQDVAGTYYYRKAAHKVYFWNIFNQVLVRPDLLKYFDENELKILDFDGQKSLLSKTGIPDKNNASDHLPIYFELTI